MGTLKIIEAEAIEQAKANLVGDEMMFMVRYGSKEDKFILVGSLDKIKDHLRKTVFKKWYNLNIFKIIKENGKYRKIKYKMNVQDLMALAMAARK